MKYTLTINIDIPTELTCKSCQHQSDVPVYYCRLMTALTCDPAKEIFGVADCVRNSTRHPYCPFVLQEEPKEKVKGYCRACSALANCINASGKGLINRCIGFPPDVKVIKKEPIQIAQEELNESFLKFKEQVRILEKKFEAFNTR